MNHVICTGDYVWVRAGNTSRHGFVQSISVNFLGQLVYWIDGQPYSDPEITRSLKVGDTVWVKLDGQKTPLVGRVLGLEPFYYYGRQACEDVAVSLEVWDGGWIPLFCPVLKKGVRMAGFREDVPRERSLAIQRR